jgi:dTDP-4-amino-4,6-dideoxygalactose transaminase
MIPRARPNFGFEDLARAAAVSGDGDVHRSRLRGLLGEYLGVDEVLLTPSGRAGLYAILKALDRPRVVVPAYTCNAVVEAAMLAGKTVAYADAEPDGFNTPADAYRELAGPDAVVIATHQFGIPCDIERTVEVCRSRGALVVEDAAPSLGTRVAGRLTGTFGDAAFFSFDTSKLIHVPLKGGAVVARDPALRERIRRAHLAAVEPMPPSAKARVLGSAAMLVGIQGPRRYRAFHRLNFDLRGTFTAESPELHLQRSAYYRYDMAEWQAAVGTKQLEQIDRLVETRRRVYAEYRRLLAPCRSFDLPPADERGEWAPIRFPIRVRGDKLAFYREAVRRGVDFAFSFTFIAAPPAMRHAHALASSVLDLPFYERLTPREIASTAAVLLEMDRSVASSPPLC